MAVFRCSCLIVSLSQKRRRPPASLGGRCEKGVSSSGEKAASTRCFAGNYFVTLIFRGGGPLFELYLVTAHMAFLQM